MRVVRQIHPHAVHHVIMRFCDRAWFLNDQVDRDAYLRRLGAALERSDWRCLAYALMSNHVHLALVAGTSSFGAFTKRIHAPFANWSNKRHDRLGPVFAHRPTVSVVRPSREARLIAYIHLNPVAEHLVERASASTWTSHRSYVNLAPVPPWLDAADGLRRCGVSSAGFDAWLAEVDGTLEHPGLTELGRAAHRRGGLEIGTPIIAPPQVPLVARPNARVRPTAHDVVLIIATELGLPAEQFCSRAGTKALVRARRVSCAVAARLGLTIAEVASVLGISRQAGSRLVGEALDDSTHALVVRISDAIVELTNVTASPRKRSKALSSAT